MNATDVQVFLSMALALIFLASAVPKLLHPRGFILAVLEYRVLPPRLGRVYARLLPPLELLLALLLLSGTSVRLAAIGQSVLLLSFGRREHQSGPWPHSRLSLLRQGPQAANWMGTPAPGWCAVGRIYCPRRHYEGVGSAAALVGFSPPEPGASCRSRASTGLYGPDGVRCSSSRPIGIRHPEIRECRSEETREEEGRGAFGVR